MDFYESGLSISLLSSLSLHFGNNQIILDFRIAGPNSVAYSILFQIPSLSSALLFFISASKQYKFRFFDLFRIEKWAFSFVSNSPNHANCALLYKDMLSSPLLDWNLTCLSSLGKVLY